MLHRFVSSEDSVIYKICPLSIWREAERQGSFSGYGIDRRDGYIHFSTTVQLRETAARHFVGQDGLALVAVDESFLGPPSNGNQRETGLCFPTSIAISR
jgi:uncharacterized protein (DUF952 family)